MRHHLRRTTPRPCLRRPSHREEDYAKLGSGAGLYVEPPSAASALHTDAPSSVSIGSAPSSTDHWCYASTCSVTPWHSSVRPHPTLSPESFHIGVNYKLNTDRAGGTLWNTKLLDKLWHEIARPLI
ncbi:uncharacterized protein [Triticum aestivum]|uniref:uncharacterized protein n=1 Tax=Triticum aestivum TaxID=4565 RepID=UPI001D02583E|nr:uncharacterized protein LOC123107572 [Triticum aestivum]